MPDNYEVYYGDKLWKLLPTLYRAEDTDALDHNGPLREMVNRIGVQAAILRRSLDRMWEDQSIESCDDWVIAYVADLLATNLVASLDARGQRLDVAKTIYYRRRKGTVAMLEELAADITGWSVRVVEFFHRLGRTRHGLDPAIGAQALQQAQGLVGPLTRTPIGGLADLRDVYGAIQAHTAFDEFYHTADFRRGAEQVGWYNIPRLGVFLWRLRSFGLDQTTPVAVQGCPGHYTFDPTGRERPLFAAGVRAYGDEWQSPAEWQLPTPISTPLWEKEAKYLYANATDLNALGVFYQPSLVFDLIPPGGVTIYPERGRLKLACDFRDYPIHVTYHYGFSARIGAGPFERRLRQQQPPPLPLPEIRASGGGNALETQLPAVGTMTLTDSLTYDTVATVGDILPIQDIVIRGDPEDATRPVIRLPDVLDAEWIFVSATAPLDDAEPAERGKLLLEGLLISGGDVVLRGDFASVTLRCCTLDPGDAGEAPALFGQAVDGRPLRPCRLWVEGQVQQLVVDRCITGPIRTRHKGAIEQLTISDSIVQAIPTAASGAADLALATTTGAVELVRCTVLGPGAVHRLEASECILDEPMLVEDVQHGCIRFSAWASGSVLPRQYESVEVALRSPIFTARVFAQPEYAQLLSNADRAILSGAAGATITAGAQNGAEMGAFASEKNPIKVRSLGIKYEEFMPLGLVPVLIYVT